MDRLPIYFAPLQGYTEAPYRLAHCEVCPGVSAYYTPFARLENGMVRRKDIRDLILPPASPEGFRQIPQIIASDSSEFRTLALEVISLGYSEINLNLGCPFPMQTARGRGSALLSSPERLLSIIDAADELKREHQGRNLSFSVKMRLGYRDPSDWKLILPILSRGGIDKIILHPRIAIQQYRGQVDMDSFRDFYNSCPLPLVFNGDIADLMAIESIQNEFENLSGIMIGRGLLSRPTLCQEYISGETFSSDVIRERTLSIHQKVLQQYSMTLQGGDGQILSKMLPFWEYLEPVFGHKAVKAIRKSRTLESYLKNIPIL